MRRSGSRHRHEPSGAGASNVTTATRRQTVSARPPASTRAVAEADPDLALAPPVAALSPENFKRLANYVTQELGIKMPEAKSRMIQSRLLPRVNQLGLASIDEYTEYFFGSAHADERQAFINAMTTNKTDFFRESSHFDFLKRTVLPELGGNRADGNRFKAWCAGCSSGEEPYSLAMVLSEYALEHPGFEFAILGTDVSTGVLEHARTGIYREEQVAAVPDKLRRKYVRRGHGGSEGLVRISPELRRNITWHQLNFLDAEYPIKDVFDVVFFRNVMIYFDPSTQQAVLNKICRYLPPGGYLFVGHSESVAGLDVPLTHAGIAVFRKKDNQT